MVVQQKRIIVANSNQDYVLGNFMEIKTEKRNKIFISIPPNASPCQKRSLLGQNLPNLANTKNAVTRSKINIFEKFLQICQWQSFLEFSEAFFAHLN